MSARPAPTREERRKRQTRLGAGLIVLAFILLLAGLGIYLNLKTKQTRLDPETFCPLAGPSAVTVVLIDRSDPLNPVQQEALRKRLTVLKDGLALHERLAVYAVSDTHASLPPPLFDLCNPGRGEGLSPLVANPERARQRWEAEFSARLDEVLATMLDPGSEPTSPILESIQAAAVAGFREIQALPRRLIIVSDMIHNTAEFSQIRQPNASFAELKASPYYRKVRADMRGVEVSVFYVRRDNMAHVQGRRHVEFWQEYFAAQGATLARVVAIEG